MWYHSVKAWLRPIQEHYNGTVEFSMPYQQHMHIDKLLLYKWQRRWLGDDYWLA